nr:lipid II flippase MurJ [uncultured Dethiosulfovibrio sp.]
MNFIKRINFDGSSVSNSIVMSAFTGISKLMGYARVLVLASLFGASAGIDSFYVAMGSLGFLVCTIQVVLESVGLPLLAKAEPQGQDKCLMAAMVWSMGIITLVMTLFLLLFSREYIRLFAFNFDSGRLDVSSKMILLLLPWGWCTVLQGLLTVWANHKGRYSIPSIAMCLFNFLVVPMLFFLNYFVGIYSIPLSFSLGSISFVLFLWYLLRDMPLLCLQIPWSMLRQLFKDSILCVGLVGAGGLYVATDRFFASGLPVGNVSAISYSETIFNLPLAFVSAPLLMYLAKSSKVSCEKGKEVTYLEAALSIGWGYFLPVGVAIAVLAKPIVALTLSYGQFDEEAARLTASCLFVMGIGLPLALWQIILVRYAQSLEKLKILVVWGYFSVLLNVFLDWLLVPYWGIQGICFATAVIWGGSSLFYLFRLAPGLFQKIFKLALCQVVVAGLWGALIFYADFSDVLSISVTVVAVLVHFPFCQRLGFFKLMPPNWWPSSLLSFISLRWF